MIRRLATTLAAATLAAALIPATAAATPLDPITCHGAYVDASYNIHNYLNAPMSSGTDRLTGNWCTNGSVAWATAVSAVEVYHSGTLGPMQLTSSGSTTAYGDLRFYANWKRPITCPIPPYVDASVTVHEMILVSMGGSIIGYDVYGYDYDPTCMYSQVWQSAP